ncbi:hypothetical protein ED733_002218 [Metarhizium rileyi]|uniref:Uncharacterized protein n=1 Tax=Metarhizium rileyi (strain RCEF 4871) TaxID=1649241 RepID=A0A5C6G1G3_METRR|nr:hypothetical protein ED733_002218 [Metarhizium rileyi]
MKCAIVIATALAGPGLAVSVLPAGSGRDGFQVLRRSNDEEAARHAATARSRFEEAVKKYIKQFQDVKSIEWARCNKQEELGTCRDVLRGRNAEFEDFIKTEVAHCRDQFESCNSDDCIPDLYVMCLNVVEQKTQELPPYDSSALAGLVDGRSGRDKTSHAGPIKHVENDDHLQDKENDEYLQDIENHDYLHDTEADQAMSATSAPANYIHAPADYIKNTENGWDRSFASPSISSFEAGSAKYAKAGSSRCRDHKVKTSAAYV